MPTKNGVGVEIPLNLYFYDFDNATKIGNDIIWSDGRICSILDCCILAYKTNSGVHVFCNNHHEYYKQYIDKYCPCTIVRIFPNNDFKNAKYIPDRHWFTDFIAWCHGWRTEPIKQYPETYLHYFSFPDLVRGIVINSDESDRHS